MFVSVCLEECGIIRVQNVCWMQTCRDTNTCRLKLFTHYHGDKIDCPMRLYRPEFIADLVKNEPDRRERAKIARAGGYLAKVFEGLLSKRRKENETE